MTYLLYMKRSFTRSPRRHAVLFAVLTCAFLLPLLISIYRDSNAWGTRQYLLARSAGETYHIGNATEADMPYFEGIRGLSAPVYRDNTIYLHILSDEEWRNSESVTVFENEIRKRMEASGNEALLPTAFSYEYAHGISTDPSHLSGQRILLLVNMLVILLSVSVVRSAYRSHLKRFSSDIGTLRACGASRRQISALFAAELAAVFLLAAACAVVISVVSLKALFTAFLEIRHDSLAWLIFHVKPMNILLHLAVFFVTLGLSLGMTLHRYSREPARALLNDAENAPKVKRGRKPLRRRFTPAATLCGLWRSRTNRSLRSCLAVSVPVMAVFLLLFNILTVALQVTGAPGTGKSYIINETTKNESVIRTTFHPDSDYSTFVGAYKPTTIQVTMRDVSGHKIIEGGKEVKEDRIVYEFVNQAFLQAYIQAWKYYAETAVDTEPRKQYLIIEEINRGNCAQIFGDLFQLLDRNDTGFSDYPIYTDNDMRKQLLKAFEGLSISQYESINSLYNGRNVIEQVLKGEILLLPSNLYIWATMNTSDQSLFPVDSAFKRRWEWQYMPIGKGYDDSGNELNWKICIGTNEYDWWSFIEKINLQIGSTTNSEDKELGFFFCKAQNNRISAETFVGKVIFTSGMMCLKTMDLTVLF